MASEGPAVLQGTAGSTGAPRTAILSPGAVLSNLRGLNQRVGTDAATDVGCSWLPLYHDMGLAFVLSAALAGAPLWLAPTTAFTASPFRWLSWLSDSGATMTAAPNFAYNLIGKYARRVSEVDLGALRVTLNGGEPVDCDGLTRFAEAMAPFGFDAGAVLPSYGLAESTCAVTVPVPGIGLLADRVIDGSGAHKHAVLGNPIPGMEVRISCGDQAAGNASREIGEIEIRGASMMAGYLGQQPIDLTIGLPPATSAILALAAWWCVVARRKSSPSRDATSFRRRSSWWQRKFAECAKAPWSPWAPVIARPAPVWWSRPSSAAQTRRTPAPN